MHRTLIFIVAIIVTATFTCCDKAPNGVIKESDMAHVLADFAKAEELMAENPALFPDDSSKLALKQSILKKYDADLAMYDSSLVWYAHNLKIYSKVHEKAIEILEKENNNGKPVTTQYTSGNLASNSQNQKRVFSTSGDSANVWKEPKQWIITNAMRDGYITFDYLPPHDNRKGDKYQLCFKMLNSGNSITLLLAVDYLDGYTSYINRTAHVNGWSDYSIQGDTSRIIKRIYGFIRYKTRPQGITFIDSTYLLRTHYDKAKYSTISQKLVGPKAAIQKNDNTATSTQVSTANVSQEQQQDNNSYPGRSQDNNNSYPGRPAAPPQGPIKPKPGLHKSSMPGRGRIPNPNGDHVPRPPVR